MILPKFQNFTEINLKKCRLHNYKFKMIIDFPENCWQLKKKLWVDFQKHWRDKLTRVVLLKELSGGRSEDEMFKKKLLITLTAFSHFWFHHYWMKLRRTLQESIHNIWNFLWSSLFLMLFFAPIQTFYFIWEHAEGVWRWFLV